MKTTGGQSRGFRRNDRKLKLFCGKNHIDPNTMLRLLMEACGSSVQGAVIKKHTNLSPVSLSN